MHCFRCNQSPVRRLIIPSLSLSLTPPRPSLATFNMLYVDSIALPKQFAGYIIGKKGCGIQDIAKRAGVQIFTNNEETACRFVIRGDPAAVQHAKSLVRLAVSRERHLRLLSPTVAFVILNRDLEASELTSSRFRSGREIIHFLPASSPGGGAADPSSTYYKIVCSKSTPGSSPAFCDPNSCSEYLTIPTDPATHSFCETTAIPSCLQHLAREMLGAAGNPEQQLSVEIRLGHQLFSNVPVAYVDKEGYGGMMLSEWCTQEIGKPIQTSFKIGLPVDDMALLMDWLYLEGFTNTKTEDVVVLHYTSYLCDRRLTACLKWDDNRGRWYLSKLRDRYCRHAILSFVEPHLNSVDHRLSLSSRDPVVERTGVEADRTIRDYVQMKQAQLARINDRRRMRFADSSEILFECVEYQNKKQYRNNRFKVTIASVDQDIDGRITHHHEVTIAHLAWKRLKDIAKPAQSGSPTPAPGRTAVVDRANPAYLTAVVQAAAQAMPEAVAFAGKMARVLAIY